MTGDEQGRRREGKVKIRRGGGKAGEVGLVYGMGWDGMGYLHTPPVVV